MAWDIPYLPIDPKDLGRSYEAVIRVNSQSGKGGISYLLEAQYGVELPRRLQIEFSQVVQQVMDAGGKELTAQDIWQVFEREYALDQPGVHSHHVDRGRATPRRMSGLRWRRRSCCGGAGIRRGGPRQRTDRGLRAMAINQATGHRVRVLDYHEHALGSGADARAIAYLELRIDEQQTLFGVGIDASIVAASLKAIVSALGRARIAGATSAAAAASRPSDAVDTATCP